MMIGRTVGQYKILEQLGSGGMGIVYKAHDTKLDRTVALKFLPPSLSSDESAKARFIQEARAASALDHANICTIHDIGEDDSGQLFIVMSFYDGQTLKYLLQNGALEQAEAVRVAHQISRGLARAHEAGIVHRDVKPANIMVTMRGDVKILDFGVAKLSESIDLTKAGSTVGTAAYMSPEQARGETVDRRADIWSIGVLLYEMLTGTAPFGGGYEAALVYAIINEDPAPLPESIEDGLAMIARRCVSKTPSDRYESADELALDLETFLSPSGSRAVATTSSSTAANTAVNTNAAPSAVPGNGLLIGAFLPVAAIVLTLVWAGMMEFGLPYWVFTAGVVLMLFGLPVLLFSASLDRRRASGDDLEGLTKVLTVKRSAWGGVAAMSGLSLVSAVFMVMRIMGIGPAATLVSSGDLVENAKLIVADFENKTTDEALAESVTELVRIDLSQSNAVKVMDGADIVSVLSLMNRPTDSAIDINTAMEIANRAGAEAVVAGEISPIGRGFVISLRLLAADDGSELIPLRETAEDDGAIIAAIDRLSGKLREQIGESIKTIRDNEALDRVTTNSLDALRLYSEGVDETDQGNHARALDRLQQAVALDSTFGMAYRKLAVVYSNAGMPAQLEFAAITKAYELRDRMPERERGLTEAYYYGQVEGDIDKEIAAYENVLGRYPDESAALNNVSIEYNLRGQFDRSEVYLKRALAIGDRPTFYMHLLSAYMAQKNFGEADALLEQMDERMPNNPFHATLSADLAFAKGDFAAADTLIRAAGFNGNTFWRMADAGDRANLATARGRLGDASIEMDRVRELNLSRGAKAAGLESATAMAAHYLDATGDAEQALALVTAALKETPLDSLDVGEIPYPQLISVLSRSGDVERAQVLFAEYEDRIPEGVRLGDWQSFLAKSNLMTGRGDLTAGLAALDEYYARFKCDWCLFQAKAQIMERMDSLDAAASYYQADLDNTIGYGAGFRASTSAPTYFRLGEIHSQLGNFTEALEDYQNFVDIWVDADANLQPQVQYARDRIDQLLKQSAREPE